MELGTRTLKAGISKIRTAGHFWPADEAFMARSGLPKIYSTVMFMSNNKDKEMIL